ncbi:MAG: pentose kinase [Clostridiales Family XIII bacterium]|jgi:xylulokinase|nr:pentose kinase [Clostridiales Family XIII bacterium]
MMQKIIVYDIGTSGMKSTLYSGDGYLMAESEIFYATTYPNAGWHEQEPESWWKAVVTGTRSLLSQSCVDPKEITCTSVSGHYFGAVPIGRDGRLLRSRVPIWSDTRSLPQGNRFVDKVGRAKWYAMTGRDLPASCGVARILWLAENEPDLHAQVWKYLPTKDYINFRLTGKCKTDPSDASGSGVYSLLDRSYSEELIAAAGFEADLLPEIIESSAVVGELSAEASAELGLPRSVKVVCGGGDTCCMALGAKGYAAGKVHTSLGSSAFIALTAGALPSDNEIKPNIFAHVIPDLFVITRNLHSAGNAFRWVRDVICPDLVMQAAETGADPYEWMTDLAAQSPLGANRLIFNPTLAMGGPQDSSINTKGAFTGLDLRHDRKDLIRASMEGISLSLAWNLTDIRKISKLTGEMLLVGGGSNSPLWRQIFADVYEMPVVKTTIGQNAGTLGALALAAVGTGLWKDYQVLETLHVVEDLKTPIKYNSERYKELMAVYRFVAKCQAEIGNQLAELKHL